MSDELEIEQDDATVQNEQSEDKPEPKPAPKPAAKPKGKVVSDEDWAEFQRLKQEQSEAKADREKAEEEKAKAKGEYEKLLQARDAKIKAEAERAAKLEQRAKTSTLQRDLASAIAGHPILAGKAAQLQRLLSDGLEVVEDGEGWKTQSLDGKDVAEYVAEALASDEYSHFIQAEKRGGTGAKGGSTPAPTAKGGQTVDLVAAIKAKMAETDASVPSHYLPIDRRSK